jgi:predicted  nucleic acid-binding Zn-ribbon protein
MREGPERIEAMATQDEITIPTGTTHTTEFARLSKEYAVVYEKWQTANDDATRLLAEAERKQQAADALKPQVEALKQKLRELVK